MDSAVAKNIYYKVLKVLTLIFNILYYFVVNTIKAFLPIGLLPRKSVKNNIVLITGAGSGLGRLMAIEFGKLGATVVLWDIDAAGNNETKEILESNNVKCYAYTIDLSQKNEIFCVSNLVKDEVGDVDILINNAGIVSGKKLIDCPNELIEKTMAINAISLFWTTKCFLPEMIKKNYGHIVTIASLAGHQGVFGLVDYCASKHAAVGFSDALNAELKAMQKDIYVTTVNPFYINTGMFNGVKSNSSILFPILEPSYVVEQIMEAILTNKVEIFLPKAAYVNLFLKGILPKESFLSIIEYFGVDKAMNDFVGRNKNNNNNN